MRQHRVVCVKSNMSNTIWFEHWQHYHEFTWHDLHTHIYIDIDTDIYIYTFAYTKEYTWNIREQETWRVFPSGCGHQKTLGDNIESTPTTSSRHDPLFTAQKNKKQTKRGFERREKNTITPVNGDSRATRYAPVVRLDVLDGLAVVFEDIDPHYSAIEGRVRALDHFVVEVLTCEAMWRVIRGGGKTGVKNTDKNGVKNGCKNGGMDGCMDGCKNGGRIVTSLRVWLAGYNRSWYESRGDSICFSGLWAARRVTCVISHPGNQTKPATISSEQSSKSGHLSKQHQPKKKTGPAPKKIHAPNWKNNRASMRIK